MIQNNRLLSAGLLFVAIGLVLFTALPLAGQATAGPVVQTDLYHGVTPALSDLISQSPGLTPNADQEAEPGHRIPLPPGMKPASDPDSVLQQVVQSAQPGFGLTVAAGFNGLFGFDGQGVGPIGPVPGVVPPDTNGAVGSTQYVQWVNTSIAVFDKNTGNLLLGPADPRSLWQNSGTACAITNDGDPIVLYDKLANRWVLSQFSISAGSFLQCVAVSSTSNALGSYEAYVFGYSNFDDYPKMGVWPDGYYTTFNMFNGNTFLGAKVCVYDRAAMLNALPTIQICFPEIPSVTGILPADVDGTTPPPAGSPNYLLSFGAGTLNLFKFHANFTFPFLSTLQGPFLIPVAPFTPLCGGGACVAQPGTTTPLDSLADRLMYRLAYRNFGAHESLVVNHSVATLFGGGVRWYEIQNPNGSPVVAQQSTFAPDSRFRWMGSIAMDRIGDMAMGYSISGSTTNPSIAVTGRAVADPPNTMQAETTIINGGGSQLGNCTLFNTSGCRWGDYSAIAVDPVDDCTFWYTTEYLKSTGSFNWSTRIAKFKFPNCSADFALSASPASVTAARGASVTSTISVNAVGGFTGNITLSAPALPAGVTATFTPVTTASSSVLTLTISNIAALGPTPIVIAGTSGLLTRTTTLTLTVIGPIATLTPSTLAFPDTVVGNSSDAQTLTLANIGTAPLLISGIVPPGDFSRIHNCPASLPAGTNCAISVFFSPTVGGTRSGALTVTDNAANSPQTSNLSGNGLAPIVTLSTTTLSFGNQTIGTSSPTQSVTLSNTGTAPLIISGKSISTDFAQTNDCPSSLAVSAMCTFTVTFTPTFTGAHLDSNLSITDNAPGSPHKVALSGSGVIPVPVFSPTALTFSQLVGTPSPSQSVTLSNTGTAPLIISGKSISTDFAQTNDCPPSLAVNSICTFTVIFTPTFKGVHPDSNLSITDNAPGSPHKVTLNGIGTSIDLSPASLVFPSQIVQTTSSPQTITLTNNTTNPLAFTSIFATGIDFAASNTCQPSLAVSTSCTISVTFTPSATGPRTATLLINDNAPNSPQTASLSGTGLPLVPVLTGITPSTVTTGSSDFTLIATGSSFASNAVVQVNGSARQTRFVNFTKLNATIFATDLVGNQPLSITVFNPAPSGATSASLPLTLTTTPISLISNLTPPRVIECDPALSPTPCPSFKLIVNGSFFPSDAVVQIDGVNRVTTFINTNQLTATILPADLIISRFASIKVFSPTGGLGANDAPLAVFRYGDLAFDNGVSSNDLLFMANILAGNVKPLDSTPGDVLLDGNINVTDLNTLANFLAGNIPHLPVIPDQTAILFNAGAPVSLSPPTFAGQTVGTTSEPLSLQLTNGGPTPLSISSVNIAPVGEFTETNNCVSLTANASCTINVTFSPTGTGKRSAVLTVTDNAGNSPQTANLSGTGIGSAAASTAATTAALSSSLGITDGPVTLTFPSQTVGTNSLLQRLRLINTGPTALSISGINIAPSGEFSESDNCGTSLAAGTSCNINVTFSPAVSGTRTATLTVTDNASNSPQTATLTGIGGP